MASTISGRRPSEKLGTHSTSAGIMTEPPSPAKGRSGKIHPMPQRYNCDRGSMGIVLCVAQGGEYRMRATGGDARATKTVPGDRPNHPPAEGVSVAPHKQEPGR